MRHRTPIVPIVAALALGTALLFGAARAGADGAGGAGAAGGAAGGGASAGGTGASAGGAAAGAAASLPSLQIEVFSMGQADSMLIVGRGKTVLVDCGVPNKGWRGRHARVADAIQRLTGKKRVDALIITHFHSDHIGDPGDRNNPGAGVWGLVDAGIKFGTIYDHGDQYPAFGEESYPHKQWVKAIPDWKRRGVFQTRKVPAINEKISLGGGAELRFVAANGNGELQQDAGRFRNGLAPNENDYSVAFVLSSGNFEMFSGGDMSGHDTTPQRGRDDLYTDIESRVAPLVGNVEILRANHHGSRHSSNDGFVKTLKPEVTIFSCGKDNPFQHPAVDTVQRCALQGKVFATSGLSKDWKNRTDAPDVAGDIVIRVADDGGTYTLYGSNGQFYAGVCYADWEEALGIDKRSPNGGPRVPFLTAAW